MPTIQRMNWRVEYNWSRGSGLRLGACTYLGQPVIHSASVPFVYVGYVAHRPGHFTDKLKSNRTAIEIRDIMKGFDLKVTYDWYGPDYEYNHVWRFHEDGQFGSSIVIQGPGEESLGQHKYHLPFRFHIKVSGANSDAFQKLSNGRWTDVAKEGRHKPFKAPAFEWRVTDKANSRSVEARGRKGDDAEVWALQYKTSESWASWGSAGRGVPGSPKSVPAIYARNQSVQDTNLVIWYIAHVSAVDRVSACGPWFRLDGYPKPPRKKRAPHGHM